MEPPAVKYLSMVWQGNVSAVRNSGAYAVVEGVGEHGCEYMTGGRVVVLGKTGKNFAAGMSGGIAYVLDENSHLYRNLNKDMISIEKVENKYDIKELKELIEEHVEATGSERGALILEHFQEYLPKFKKIIPNDYQEDDRSFCKAGRERNEHRAGTDGSIL